MHAVQTVNWYEKSSSEEMSIQLPWAAFCGGEEGWVWSQAETKGLCSICPVPKGSGTSVQHPCLWLPSGASLTGLSPELLLLLRAELCCGVMGKMEFSKTWGNGSQHSSLSRHLFLKCLPHLSHLNPSYTFNCSLEHCEHVVREKKRF